MRTRLSASFITPFFCGALIAFGQAAGTIVTVAGNGTFGYNGDNIAATVAEIGVVASVAIDSAGNI